jgi:hypothetical protein
VIQTRHMLKAISQSVFKPRSLLDNQRGFNCLVQYGWILIVVRWLYYTVLFQFRDYHGRWAPFVSTPFDIEIDTYAALQQSLSLPFGIILMLMLSMLLVAYLQLIKKKVSFFIVLNILGTTFFLPFVLVQPVDQVIIALRGWELVPVVVIHTAILIWESWASVKVISIKIELKIHEKLIGIVILSVTWILITGPIWR